MSLSLPADIAMVREDVLQKFPDLFGGKTVNGRHIHVEETITRLTRELRPEIDSVLSQRRALLQSPEPAARKYAWPEWSETFEDPLSTERWSFHQIVSGLIDNFAGRESRWRWRLNDEVLIPADAHPLTNPGLELTGPWSPLDMAFNALNSPAPMNMPDFEDAAPAHFRPEGTPHSQPLGNLLALQNATDIFAGRWDGRPYEPVKKGHKRTYKIDRPPSSWPTRFVRPPSLHLHFDFILVDGQPVPATIAIAVLWTLNNYDSLKRAGTGVYFYIPKLQTPREALIVERLLTRLEETIGLPAGTFKIKILYEEGNAGRFLPAILWTLRRRLLGANVGRWDYLGSRIEMWKDDPQAVFPDPQRIGMATPGMIAYQRYNALLMLMAGMKNGALTQGAPIGGMAAVMMYQNSDPYGRSRYNPLAMRAIAVDKLRERLLGLIFVPGAALSAAEQPTLEEILAGRINGRLYDTYRQSWVASPEQAYVAAGNLPLQTELSHLQDLLDAPLATVDVKGSPVPTPSSGLSAAEREMLQSRGLLDSQGRITPRVLPPETLDTPEKFLTPELWQQINSVPQGEITIEGIQHSFYMAANYGFQILNGNFAAAIDDYELKLRFMNDLATYRINVSWLWTLVYHQAKITRDGYLRRAELTEDGVELTAPTQKIAAGTRFTPELFAKVWSLHNEWTAAFFAELDRRGDPGRFNRSKASVIMDLLKRQLLSPHYIQHSARVLFVVGQSGGEILEALFDLDRTEIAHRAKAGSLSPDAAAAYNYVYDLFPPEESFPPVGAGCALQ